MKKRAEVLTSLLALLLLLASSCATTQTVPAWVNKTPQDDGIVHYVVGGPANTLVDARAIVFQELAERLNQKVTAQTHLKSMVSTNDFDSFVHENLQTWVEIGSEAIIAGVETKERWQDPQSQAWWILAAISEQQLINSYQKTLESWMVKDSEKESHLAILKEMILPYFTRTEDVPASTVMDDIKLLASAYNYLSDNIVSSPKSIEIDGCVVELDTYLMVQLMKLLDGIQIKVSNYQQTFPADTDLATTVSISHDTNRAIGVTPWTILVDNQYFDDSYKILEDMDSLVLNRTLFNQCGAHTVTIKFDGRGIGAEKYAWWNRILPPNTEFIVDVVESKIQWQFKSESSYEYSQTDYLSSKAMIAVSTLLKEDFSTEESVLGQLKLLLRSHEGTQNSYGIFFLHGHIEIVLYDWNGDRIYGYIFSPVTVSGIDLNRTATQLADQLVLQIQKEKTFQKDLQQSIEQLKSRTKEQHHEKSSM